MHETYIKIIYSKRVAHNHELKSLLFYEYTNDVLYKYQSMKVLFVPCVAIINFVPPNRRDHMK